MTKINDLTMVTISLFSNAIVFVNERHIRTTDDHFSMKFFKSLKKTCSREYLLLALD